MKALVYKGPKHVEVCDVPEPVPKEGCIPLNIIYTGVCGSDVGIYLGTHPRAKAPLILGHEFLGEVAEDGEKFHKGDHVVAYPLISCGHCLACRSGNEHVCNSLGLIGIDTDGGMCERLYCEEDRLFKVPEGVSDRAAVVTEPLAVILHSLHMVHFEARENAVVIGAGPIGMLTGIMLKNCGASKVFISDVFEKRLKIAEELGLTPVNVKEEDLAEVVKAATDGEGCDVLFECSGAESAAIQMTDVTRVRGRICMTSVHKAPHSVDLREFNFKEQTMVGTRVYTKEEFRQTVEYLPVLEKELEKVVTHLVPLSQSDSVFDIFADPESGSLKVAVDCTR